MAIIYSYPIATPQDTDLLIISRTPEDPDEISNYSVNMSSVADYVIDRFIDPDATDFQIPVFNQNGNRITGSIMSQDSSPSNGVAGTKITIAGNTTITGDVQIDTLTNNYIPVNNSSGVLSDSGFYQVSAPTLSDNAIGLNTTQLDSVFGEYPDFRVASRSLNDPGVLDLFRPDGDVVAGDRVGILQYSLDDNANYAVAQIEVKTIGNSGTGNGGGGKLCIKTSDNGTGSIPTERLCIDNTEADFSVPVNVTSTTQSSFAGQVTIPETPIAGTDAASKAYVDLQGSGQVSGTGTTNVLPIWTDGPNSDLGDSIVSESGTTLTIAGQLNVDEAATFDTSITVTGDSTLNGSVILGDASADLITQTGTLYLNGPVKDTTDALGGADQVLVSDASGELTFTDLADISVGSAEVVEVPVKNLQGSALTKGDPVYISGSVDASGRLEVKLADASNAAKMPALGLLKQDLGIDGEGFAVVTGKLRNLVTDPIDGQASSANDVIYVKAGGTTGAALTLTKPTGSNLIQNMGKVGRASASNDGTLVVSSILRTNDIPNLTPGKIWVGSTGNTVESSIVDLSDSDGLMTLEGTMKAEQVTVRGNSQPLILSKSTTPNAHITMRLDGESAGFISSKENHIGIGGNNGYSTDNLNIARATGYVGIQQRLPLAPLHVKNNGEAIRLESFGDDVCSIDFRQGTIKRGHLEFDNAVDTLELKTTNPTGSESQIKFSTALGVGVEAVERMRIKGSQVVIGNPPSVPSSRELYVNGGIDVTGQLFVGGNTSIGGRCDADSYKLKGLNTPPATATSPGVNGEIRYTSDYIYVCVQNNVWKRTALTTW